MDSLMAALVAALLLRATDPSADLVAIAAERSRRTGLILLGAATALIVTQAVAAAGGWLVASHLNPHAARLQFAVSLLMEGGGALGRGRPARAIDLTIGGLLLAAGACLAVSALRLI